MEQFILLLLHLLTFPISILTGNISIENVVKRSYWSKSTEDPEKTLDLIFFEKDMSVFDMDDLLRASAEVLGKGKLSTTYKAILESGSVVAVKRLKEMNSLSKKEFTQQIQLLGKLKHENLVEMMSFYYSKDEKLIVYEYVPQGDLFELLHGSFINFLLLLEKCLNTRNILILSSVIL